MLQLYFLTALLAGTITAAAVALLYTRLGPFLLDIPTQIKTHAKPIPVLGGCALFLGLAASLLFIRYTTHFPTGTLHSLRGILSGALVIFVLGLVDDLYKPQGLSISVKLLGQLLAGCCLLKYGVHINLFEGHGLCYLLTLLWVVGITNAFNLLDIADGLCIGQAFICTAGLYAIALPSEQIYVNFGACALLGACIGFWPYNHAKHFKTFLGDSGSTLLGFLLAALAMGADYSQTSRVGFLAPLFILAVPLFDTTFVSMMRLLQRKNPLLASKDHAFLRLRKQGWRAHKILVLFLMAGILFNGLAWIITQVSAVAALAISVASGLVLVAAAGYLARIKMDDYA